MTDGVKPLLQSQGSHARYDMAPNMETQKRKKVLVVGAGAAGTCRFLLTMIRRMLTIVQE
jgi:spermidine synthase